MQSNKDYQHFCFQEVVDNYIGIVKMIDTGDRIKLDQEHLETVIPAIRKYSHYYSKASNSCLQYLAPLVQKL